MSHFNGYSERKSETFGGTLDSHEVEREIPRELKATFIKAMTYSVSKVEKASCCLYPSLSKLSPSQLQNKILQCSPPAEI